MKHLNPLKPLHCGPDEPEMSFKLRLRVEYKIELHTRAWSRSGASHHAWPATWDENENNLNTLKPLAQILIFIFLLFTKHGWIKQVFRVRVSPSCV